MTKEPLAARLLEAFFGELDEQVRVLNADLLALEREPADRALLQSVFRVAHTLKGAARAAGVAPVERACHALETLLAEARDGRLALRPQHFAILFAAADALAEAGQRLRAGQGLEGAAVELLPSKVRQAHRVEAAHPPMSGPAPGGAKATAAGGEGALRVQASKLDALLAATGELSVASGRFASRPAEASALHADAARSASDWSRARRRIRLALERAGAPEAVVQAVSQADAALGGLVQNAARLASGLAADARALAPAIEAVSAGARGLRMRPFLEACEALPRAVRDLAAAAGKSVELEIRGGEVEVDRAVLDRIREALLQLVRNAVAHGVEPPSARARLGKPAAGALRIGAEVAGDRVVITVADDGAGLDTEALRRHLAQRGAPAPDDDRQLVRALLEGGLTSMRETTPLAGRGVGLDIVRAALEAVRGWADITWVPGRGTTVTLDCPVTLAVIRAVLVSLGPDGFAIPVTHVDRLLRLPAEHLKRADGRDLVATATGPVPLVPLAGLLAPLPVQPLASPLRVVLLRAGDRRLAIAVDELIAEREVMMKPLGQGIGPTGPVSGAAILGTGETVLVLNPAVLISTGLAAPMGTGVALAGVAPGGPSRRRILVVDDSITTRTLEQSILEAAGYDVTTAVDGAEGWRILQERGADLVVADVDMPRMNGYALCEAIRGSARFKQLPVVLVTALETTADRARGSEAGADAYLGKSSFDQEHLLEVVAQLIGGEAA